MPGALFRKSQALTVEKPEDLREVAPPLEDDPRHRNDREGPLAARERGPFLNPVKGRFGGATKY